MNVLPRLFLLPLLALALSGCDALNTASETLDKAEVCTQALQAAGFEPDLSNPDQTIADAKQRSEELRDLANKTTDAEVKQELNEMADKLGQLGPEDLDPATSVAWAQDKLETYNRLQAACTGSN